MAGGIVLLARGMDWLFSVNLDETQIETLH